ncbi:hypothetical protein FEE95_10150 [Maribacter algarum]|uniref:Phosphate-selective porin O and P n=1 Tax=Maribacter algarum (ex Zhang et al. 2020) TaxID=2578118 RepID=A0A5S3PQ69_9FLAO|nr:hypothetical protein [Maribacter algarum]TMM56852.1 hypothetical protein FEE95_10150 [Maribacter algarum]
MVSSQIENQPFSAIYLLKKTYHRCSFSLNYSLFGKNSERISLKRVLLLFFVFGFSILSYSQNDSITKPKLKVDLGGALRYNYNNSTWKPNQQKRGGDFGFEVFRINVDAAYGPMEIHIDQRFYSGAFGGAFLKYGWVQYNLNKKSHLKLGLIPGYFGPQQFNSHSWFFQLPFYLGFEDDHDMGISYDYEDDRIKLDIGFYKNAEALTLSDNNPVSPNRYSYDFSGRNKEVNQFNIRFNYKLGEKAKHLLGTSLQYGGIWNIDTQDVGNHSALGLHYQLDYKRWNLQTQFITYNNKPKNAEGESREFLEQAAYNFPYNTAAKASMYSIGLAYTIPVNRGRFQSIQLYNDYTYMDKSIATWEDTQMNILGALISIKPLYIYVDYASGRNQPWLTPNSTDALTTGDGTGEWHHRLNVNFGLYF